MSIMDPLVVDETLSACLERDWEGGIDNDGLDISQLESYINDDNNDTMYFGDLQGGMADIKALGNATPRDSPSRLHHHHHHSNLHHHQAHSQHSVTHPDLSSSDTSSASMSGYLPTSSDTGGIRHPPQAVGGGVSLPIGYCNPYHSYYYSSSSSAYKGYRHHLPDSPPDSGSEPPYSPPDHPNLSPHQKVGGMADMYTSPPGGGSGGMMAFPYPVMQAPQTLPHQPNPSHNTGHAPLQGNNSLGYQQPLMLGGSPLSGSSVPGTGLASTGSPVYGTQGVVSQGPASGGGGGAGSVAAAKKRKMNDSGGLAGMVNIKQEPDQGVTSHLGPNVAVTSYTEEDEYTMDSTGGSFLDSSYQCIRFHNFQQHSWSILCDSALKELPLPTFRVDADKGFNFSNPDESFVCQKKNHFQVTVHVQASGEPVFVKSPDGLQKVDRFYVHFFGVKTESPSQVIRVEQSQSDRSKKAFHPVPVELKPDQMSKITVGRLHFSETTSNNMRKKGKPNPDQRYFYLVVSLKAHCGDNSYHIAAHASEKIIVRASNPGQFESDVEYTFQRGTYPESIYHMGRVGINTDRPDEALVIHGNLKITGQLLQPSDKRAKKDVAEMDTKEQLKNVQNLRVVKYAYRKEFAEQAGMKGDDVYDTGVIAQEVKEVIPDAVKTTGDVTLSNGEKIESFLLVNKERIFMENVGAVKELCKVTGNLENRIGELEIMNKKISQLRRFESFKSTSSSVSTRTSATSRVSSVCNRSRGCSRRHKHMGSGHDDGICNNKTLQVTTITLVCIMAFCLMAMATIYILDYKERRKDPATTTATTTTATTIFLSSSMVTSTLRTATTDRTTSSTDDVSHTSVVFTTKPTFGSTTPDPLIPRPPVIGKPDYCQETDPNEDPVCQVYCCPLNNIWTGVMAPLQLSPSTASTTVTLSRRIIHYGTTTVPPTMSRYGEVITNKLSTSDPNTVNDSTTQAETQRLKPMPSKKSGPHDQMARLARHRAQMSRPSNSRSIKQTLSKRSIHSKRSTDSSPRQKTQMSGSTNVQIPTIDIVELNTTISHLYCLNSSDTYSDCFSNRAKNFTYGLPISRFMPHTNLTLHFRFLADSFARQPSFCTNRSDSIPPFPFEQCPVSGDNLSPYEVVETNGPSPRDRYVTLTNVGMWLQVAYKFRIPIIDEDDDPCNCTPEYVGEKFYELNFIFQRVCTE
ncbi:myelin regulatory factor-like protein isoform X3 [Homarus americanus]|uniref:myelin regulatory factor-like protein isoform X3 n=1 Tax=Homarus americanus TaxID=6706 RepID=UPI001C474AD8|nr:myelin regulatory factor-like protein isoform X3 [Homarus americanus]